jgi:hypothetical protein
VPLTVTAVPPETPCTDTTCADGVPAVPVVSDVDVMVEEIADPFGQTTKVPDPLSHMIAVPDALDVVCPTSAASAGASPSSSATTLNKGRNRFMMTSRRLKGPFLRGRWFRAG